VVNKNHLSTNVTFGHWLL